MHQPESPRSLSNTYNTYKQPLAKLRAAISAYLYFRIQPNRLSPKLCLPPLPMGPISSNSIYPHTQSAPGHTDQNI